MADLPHISAEQRDALGKLALALPGTPGVPLQLLFAAGGFAATRDLGGLVGIATATAARFWFAAEGDLLRTVTRAWEAGAA